VTFPVVFGPQGDRPRKNVKIVPPTPVAPAASAPAGTDTATSRTARSLALATLIERRIEAGQIRDHAHAATLLGLTRPNMAYIMNLLHLAADTQQALLMGDLVISERRLRPVARMLDWNGQRGALDLPGSRG
jgi:hypothetical protein